MANILLIVGTNRPGANALRLAKVVEELYRQAGEPLDTYGLHQMPREIFDSTSYAQKPAAFKDVQDRVVAAKGLHIITPEYNGGFPGVLKYFIDMLKFPASFERKPVAFVGEAAGIWGAIRPVEQLQHIFGYRNAYVFPERVFLPKINERFDAAGAFIDAEALGRLDQQVRRFIQFANCVATMPSR